MEKLNEVLATLKTLGASIGEFAGKLNTSDNALAKVGEKVDTIENWMRKTQDTIEKVQDVIKRQAGNLVPGLEDEALKNGAINPLVCLMGSGSFDANSRDVSIVKEYMQKRNDSRSDEYVKRDMTAGDDGKGAVFIPTIVLPGYIDLLRERSLLYRKDGGEGPKITVWPGLNGSPVEIPNITQDVTVAPAGEGEAPTASDIGTGLIKFEPRAIKSLTKLTKRLRRMGPLAATVVERSAQIKFALEIDRIGLRGSGTDKESLGVVNTPGILSTAIGTNGGNFTLATARAMRHKLRQNNAAKGARAFVGHPDPFYTAQTERILQYSGDTAGDYVMLPMDETMLSKLIGPWFDSTLFPSNLAKGSATTLCEVIYGNWEDLWLGVWEDLSFSLSDQAGDSFEKSMLWIKTEMEIDFGVVQPKSFVLCNDANSVTL